VMDISLSPVVVRLARLARRLMGVLLYGGGEGTG